ncbi:MAG: S41 family peptidase, partial [Deltaproteobacteria bacterium]|nr:S41 family peptidase [Deltaproteobacteria bacterium]
MTNGKRNWNRALLVAAIMALAAVPVWGIGSRIAVAGVESYETLKIFGESLKIVKENYAEEVTTKDLIYSAVDGMLKNLDPHSSFMDPGEYKEMQMDTKGYFYGVGMELGIKEGSITVIAPIDDSPASEAGIKAGDKIIKVDDTYVKDMSITEVVKLIRGDKGTKVNLLIMREGFDGPKNFELTRAEIKLQSVKSKELESGYGYVRLTGFQDKTHEDLKRALDKLGSSDAKFKGLVIDLRNNPGGLLKQAVLISDLFLDSGTIVSIKGRVKEQNSE